MRSTDEAPAEHREEPTKRPRSTVTWPITILSIVIHAACDTMNFALSIPLLVAPFWRELCEERRVDYDIELNQGLYTGEPGDVWEEHLDVFYNSGLTNRRIPPRWRFSRAWRSPSSAYSMTM